MTERIVVSFWMPYAGLSPATGRGYVERARALVQRGEALGGSLIAFGSQVVGVAFEPDAVEEAVAMATAGVLEESKAGEVGWGAGIAEGEVDPVAPDAARAWLAWGVPLVSGASLARAAGPGRVLVDKTFKALRTLVTLGTRVASEDGRRVRGAVLDVQQPWRHAAAALVSKLETPPLLGREDPSALLWMPGALAVLRADPGLGGSRVMGELAAMVAPGPALLLAPSGSSIEPLGSLRRALDRARAIEAPHFEPELEPALRRLLSGDGVPVDTAAAIISSFLRATTDESPAGALLIDDANDVDGASIEACARAVASSDGAFACVARVDAMRAPPASLALLGKGPEMALEVLDDASAQAFAAAALGGALDGVAQRRWARRGGNAPLGILEALAVSLSAGELAWNGDVATARTRASGRGRARPALYWIAQRAQMMGSALEQLILAFVALSGGELALERLGKLLAAANVRAHADAEAKKLVVRRWLVEPQPGWIALPSRTHREALLAELSNEQLRGIIHRALAHVLEAEERGIGLAEAAHHLARAGDPANASRVALSCARAAIGLELRGAATHLLAMARELDPSCEEEARGALALITRAPTAAAASSAGAHSGAYAAVVEGIEVPEEGAEAISRREGARMNVEDIPTKHDSEPPTVTIISPVDEGGTDDGPPSVTIAHAPVSDGPGPTSEPGTLVALGASPIAAAPAHAHEPPRASPTEPSREAPSAEAPKPTKDVGDRLTELAKEALLGEGAQSLEQWAEGLLAMGEHGRFAERMQAIVRLARGDVGDALRALRAARADLDASASPAERCRTSLALGVALAVAGRPDEALLEALEALARARDQRDDKGGRACLAFLSKLFATVERADDAGRLRRAARGAKDGEPVPSPA